MGYKMRFVEKEDCYHDTESGLDWSKENFGPMTWDEAVKQFNGIGWRLPTIEELSTLVDYTKEYPATDLPNMIPSYYWSSTTSADGTSHAWDVYFYSGHDYRPSKYRSSYVRAVRARKETGK